MPQESLRSVVYRSFVTCDDPKGVVECKTIRRSKSNSKKMEDKTKNQRTNSNTSTSHDEERKDKVPKESTKELQNLSSFQIMEVSRGAEKLSEVVDSWSNRPSVDDKQSKYIAKDLLRGALDLQESLVMLGELQEASKYISKSTKRDKEKLVRERVDAGSKFMDLDPFVDDNEAGDFQKPRVSVNRSSRDCYDELREVIRESFARQNLLPRVSVKEKDDLDRRNSNLCVDFPSSSSSQSSLIYSHSSNSPSHFQHGKPKGPNLIAKLMGLEEVPFKVTSCVNLKQMEKEKLSNQGSHLLDIDLPRLKKPQFTVQKAARERRTLEEMIETMQFKGLLERESADGSDDCGNHSDVSLLRKSLVVEGPPIVIMRPLNRVPDLWAKELHENHWISDEKHVKIRQMPKNLREKFPPSAPEVDKGQLKFKERNEKLTAGKQKFYKDKEDKNSGKSPTRLVKKTLDAQDRVSSTKINISKPMVPRMQKKEAVVRKIDEKPKVASDTRKRAEMKDAKSQGSARTPDQVKHTTLKLTKVVRESNVSKSQIGAGKVVVQDENMKSASLRSSIPKKNLRKGKLNSKPSAALVENNQSGDNLPTNKGSNIEGLCMKSTASEKITEEAMNASSVSISDNSRNAASSPSESSDPMSKDDLSVIEDCSSNACRDLDETIACKSIINTRYLLLSNVSFLNHVERLFDTGKCDHTVLPTACLPNTEVHVDSLLLDCAKEIVERKSMCYTRIVSPFSQNLLRKPKCHSSIEELVGEISDGIEHLRNYSKSCGDIVHVDNIYSMLQRDLWWNEEVTGAWDLGWRNGYTTEAVNEVVHDLQKLFLSEFVADVVVEFMPQ